MSTDITPFEAIERGLGGKSRGELNTCVPIRVGQQVGQLLPGTMVEQRSSGAFFAERARVGAMTCNVLVTTDGAEIAKGGGVAREGYGRVNQRTPE